jgi:hypothetical protein
MAKRPADELFSTQDVPEICPLCGQRIDQRSPDQITHHQKPNHLPFTAARRKGKRRWQASP